MFASSGVDVVTAIAVGGRGWAGGGTAVPVISGVDLCADVDLDVTAVRRRVGGGQVGASTPTSQWSELELVVVLAVASTPMPPRSEVEPVVVLVVASTPTTSPQSEVELVVVLVVLLVLASQQSERELVVMLMHPSAVIPMLLVVLLSSKLK